MLEEKILGSVKSFARSSFVRNAKPYLIAAALSFGAYSCGEDNCATNKDCKEGSFCGEYCTPQKYSKDGIPMEPICHQKCQHAVTSTTYVPD